MCSIDKINIDIKEYSLEDHLEIKCKNNEKYKHLYAAWITDKDIYTNSLSAVALNFPHYSKHEASHSLSIINKIEMILGIERIKSLSPTDTFLILESAFSHDLGMIIPEDLLREEWKKSSFRRFLKRLSADGFDQDITNAAKYLLEMQETSVEFFEKNRDWPVDVRDSVILITAEYFRKTHGSRSELWIKQSEKIAASINANKFIYERIMNIVGKVATAHGSNFDDMLNNLEHIQNGIGVDEIHPRFIACLIRLGDLLDLDNGRFNEVFNKTSPSPESSKVHKQKHRSITHFLVSPERIEVSAVCESDSAYRETRAWFDWLSDELKNLSSKWSDIVPKGFQGGPPSLGDIKLSIKGSEDIIKQLNLRFNIDPVRAFELIEGNGIYSDELVFIRELLQNAMDATKIKIWRDIINGHYDDVIGSIDSDFKDKKLSEYNFSFPNQLPEILKEFYPIKIDVNYEEDIDGEGENLYVFTIKDKGCGISLKDLKRMENAGGSWEQDDELQDFIETMPGWLQPTGSFGIGLHSVFLITDEIKIETKSEKEDGYNISFVSRRKNGYITLKKDNNISSTGTKITLRIKESKLKTIMKEQIINFGYDYFDSDCKKKRIMKILEKRIEEVIENITVLNVSSNLSNGNKIKSEEKIENIQTYGHYGEFEDLKYHIYLNKHQENVKKWNIKIYDKTYETIINLLVNCSDFKDFRYRSLKIQFKEINCSTIKNEKIFDIIQKLFDISIDIKKGKAKEVLAVSRDELKADVYKKYMKRLEDVIIPKALEYLYEKLNVLVKKDEKYINKEISNNVENDFQLLRLRLAFNYFLDKEEDYMKKWGNDIVIDYDGKNTFNDLQNSKYIIGIEEENVTESIKEKIKDFENYIGSDKYIYRNSMHIEFIPYEINNFSEIKRITIKNDLGQLEVVRLNKRRERVSDINFNINFAKNEEEAKNILKILFNGQGERENDRETLCATAYFENKHKFLYKDIIVTNVIENFYDGLKLKNNPYFISPFKKNIDQLIKALDYNIDKVIEILKKEHNFNELVDWVSKNAIFRDDNEDYKNKVVKTYTELIGDYLELLKEENEKSKEESSTEDEQQEEISPKALITDIKQNESKKDTKNKSKQKVVQVDQGNKTEVAIDSLKTNSDKPVKPKASSKGSKKNVKPKVEKKK